MSGVTPPQLIADFPDHPYIRSEDIIRPKPRRLVDMRRSALGGGLDHTTQLSPGNKCHLLSEGSSLSPGVMSAATSPSSFINNQIPPILPAKPYGPSPGIGGGGGNGNHIFGHLSPMSHMGSSPSPHLLQGKPLPPRPSSTNSAGLSSSVSSSPMLIKPIGLNKVTSGREGNLYTPPHHQYLHQNIQNGNMSGTPPGVNHFGMNQRSVPNLPQLLHPMTNNNVNGSSNNLTHQLLNLNRPNSSTHLQQQQQQQQHPPFSPFGVSHLSQVYQQNNNNSNVNGPHKRLFLSPQPHESAGNKFRGSNSSSNFGGSSGNLLNDSETPYYSELTLSAPKSTSGFMPAHLPFSPAQNSKVPPHLLPPGGGPPSPLEESPFPGQLREKPRVRVEWKSVENLQKHNGPRLTTTGKEIDIGPVEHKKNGVNESSGGSVGNGGSSSGFKVNHPPMSALFSGTHTHNGNNGMGLLGEERRNNNKVEVPAVSPEYDMIRTPSEIAKEMKERFSMEGKGNKNGIAGVHYVEPSSPRDLNDSGKESSNNCSSGGQTSNDSDTVVHNTLNSALTQLGKNGTESTDCSSLGRSSTSDGDFGTLGGGASSGGSASMYTANAGSTPSARKSRHSAPSSKLKSRRKNILHNLSSEEMRLLNTGPQRFASNTGTGGSSSDGSSGHASMSDSQTSGSPPAEYARLGGTGATSDSLELSTSNENNGSSTTGGGVNNSYKSVLKSVPEDESNNGASSGNLNSSVGSNPNNSVSGNNSVLASASARLGLLTASDSSSKTSPEKRIGEASLSSSGGKKSSRSRHRNKEPILLSNGNSGLEDIKQAIEQLTLRSHHGSVVGGGHHVRDNGHHSSYSTSTYSSMSGSECDRHRRPHLIRYSSLDTINTQVTSADEFVWVDSHSRLVELQHVPWSNHDILKVVEKSSRLKDSLERISMETVPRVSYLLQRALVRIARETQRLARPFGFCSKHEVSSALKVVLAPVLADSCAKACLRAAAMYSVSTSDPLHRESKSARAGLHLHVGRFHRWMVDVRLGRFVHDIAAIHLTAALENLVEEVIGQALSWISINSESNNGNPILTAALLEQAISNNGDLWGLLQPYAHLNAGRTASGALALPRRWASAASVDSSGSSTTTIGPSPHDDASMRSHNHSKSLEQSLLTTCVGSIVELADILSRVSHYHYKQLPLSSSSNGSKVVAPSWAPSAVHTLFYFMRCSQLETADDHSGSHCNLGSSTVTLGSESVERLQSKPHHGGGGGGSRAPLQELVYERPFIVLPPLIEWVRVSSAHADHRHSGLVDKDDVMQAARLLLPGIDCPVRLIGSDEFSWPRRSLDEFECNRRLKIDLAFKMLTSGRSDLVAQALLLMPPSKANTFNESGLSPLILASIRGEETMVRVLLDAGAETDSETPPNCPNFPQAVSEIQHWTALTFASLMGHMSIVKILLEKNGNVEGGAKLSEEKSTQTPLQVAAATGNLEVVSTLLSYGANPFMSTLVRDSLCYTGSAQRGSFSAISAAASHGQRVVLHKLLSHPFNQPASKEVLSLEEILAEGAQPSGGGRQPPQLPPPNNPVPGVNSGRPEEPKILSKSQVKVLQEAMYQSAENGHLDITLDMRNLGVPWTLHCWTNALATAHDLRCEPVVDQLLQDFLQILPNEDFSQGHFVEDCLPLLFTIFRNNKIEGTTLLLADMFQTCYGREPIKDIRDNTLSNGTRIDPKYVNNQELSDVQFRVEGRVFYAHKIVLVTSSPRFKSMLKSAPESNPPVLQINDIRYPIFQMVMEYLYNGGCDCIRNIEPEDVLELMAAANFFQLDGLLRFCESKCSQTVNIESIVSMYIHAKVYNAVQLMDYCQGFLLQNMVALLTFDDSVRRLIFGKKLHNHDVLAGLLLTLQARLKSRPKNSSRKSK